MATDVCLCQKGAGTDICRNAFGDEAPGRALEKRQALQPGYAPLVILDQFSQRSTASFGFNAGTGKGGGGGHFNYVNHVNGLHVDGQRLLVRAVISSVSISLPFFPVSCYPLERRKRILSMRGSAGSPSQGLGPRHTGPSRRLPWETAKYFREK